jgi:hypothetical protein
MACQNVGKIVGPPRGDAPNPGMRLEESWHRSGSRRVFRRPRSNALGRGHEVGYARRTSCVAYLDPASCVVRPGHNHCLTPSRMGMFHAAIGAFGKKPADARSSDVIPAKPL